MNKIFLIVILIIVAACSRNSSETTNKRAAGSLVGKWRLTETLMDPGDGSGTWQHADPLHPSYLEFKSDSTVVFTPPGTWDSDHYKILDGTSMIFLRDTLQFHYRYKLSENNLILNPPCYEACGMKYEAVE